MVTKADVRQYRIGSFFCIGTIISLLFAMVCEVTTSSAARLFWIVCAGCFVKMLFTGERIPSYSYMILNAWRRIFDLPVERFPVTDAERAETAEWIDREVLLKFALGTTVEREKAEKIENEERTPAYTTLCDLLKGAPPSDPEELLSYRRSVRDAGDAARQANRAYHAARRKANRTERKYLEIWDFLVKEEPEGIGLLHEKYGSMDPHEFRRSWTVRHPANDSTVTS